MQFVFDNRRYRDYARNMGGFGITLVLMIIILLENGTGVGSSFWLSYWSSDRTHPTYFYLSVRLLHFL